MFFASDYDIPTLIQNFGVPVTLLLVILFGGYKRWWVWGYQLKDAERREADWKDMALRGTLIAERATGREKWSVEQRLDFLEHRMTRGQGNRGEQGHGQ